MVGHLGKRAGACEARLPASETPMPGPNPDWLIWSQLARDWATAFTFLAILATGVFGLFRYLRSERLRQTEQVRELYRMFFESERYRNIRFILHHPEAPEFATLKAELAADGMPGKIEGQLIDLLNFFEFVSGLTRRGLVARRDVDWMFTNFIDRLVRVDFLRAYIMAGDYHELALACRRAIKTGAGRAR
jgi:hypothetical protein